MTGGLDLRQRCEAGADDSVVAILAAAVVITALALGTILVRGPEAAPPGPAARGGPPVSALTSAGSPAVRATGDPLRVRIPAIGVVAILVPLGLNGDGTLEVPPYEEAGWYARGTRPGQVGPAVIAAHVDSTTGPAVFYRLKELKRGDPVFVDYRDLTVSFVVRDARSFTKSQFPTRQVYGTTGGPELRLVTCDGAFDRKAHTYNANLVVWANIAPQTSNR